MSVGLGAQERGEGIDSKYIDTAPDVNLARFEAMLAGEATDWCLRARMGNMKNPNKCMRDPVMFRSNAVPHVRTGTRYKAYVPTTAAASVCMSVCLCVAVAQLVSCAHPPLLRCADGAGTRRTTLRAPLWTRSKV